VRQGDRRAFRRSRRRRLAERGHTGAIVPLHQRLFSGNCLVHQLRPSVLAGGRDLPPL